MAEEKGRAKQKHHEKPVFSVPVHASTQGVTVFGVVENRNCQYTVVHFTFSNAKHLQKVLVRRKGMFQLNLRTHPDLTFPDTFTIDVPIKVGQSSYMSDDFKQLNLNLRKCKCSHKDIFGNIVLRDKWYMPEFYRQRQRNAIIRDSIRQQVRAERRKPGDKAVYTYNNMTRPFSGGGVSPR